MSDKRTPNEGYDGTDGDAPSYKRPKIYDSFSTGRTEYSVFMCQERYAQLECRLTHPSQSGLCKHCAIIIE